MLRPKNRLEKCKEEDQAVVTPTIPILPRKEADLAAASFLAVVGWQLFEKLLLVVQIILTKVLSATMSSTRTAVVIRNAAGKDFLSSSLSLPSGG
jgi:hypothetical protein